jgi:(1->4)-alpha-D-glucan 1-alpha-D-glucosylmutase
MPYRVPVATYRLQFNSTFTFANAREVTAYLHELGISDLYASPLLRARKGSMHGYDIVDASLLNPEIGGEEGFTGLHEELARLGMGLILDIVPNHMAASHENAWWMSVLENGKQSRYLHYFDIDWRAVASREGEEEKVLLPILGAPYGETLESGLLAVGFDAEGLHVNYYDKRLPLAPASYALVLRECLDALPEGGVAVELRDLVASESMVTNSRFLKEALWRIHEESPAFREALAKALESFGNRSPEAVEKLDALLDAQWYRLAFWRTASETINYRRFFDVTDLVGVRVENPEVFELRNRRILDLLAEGKLSGVRIDHIDGLYDPVSYLSRLQLRLAGADVPDENSLYVVVEKILEPAEVLPASFRCAGTTGYDFLDVANALFVDPKGLGALTAFYGRFTGLTADFGEIVYERKKQVIEQLFSGEMRALAAHLGVLARRDRNARDFAPSELLAALVEVTACMPVYRSYVREAPAPEDVRGPLREAIACARTRGGAFDGRVLDFVERVLFVEPPRYLEPEKEKWLAFVMRWQQFTGRVMAKGVEDTAFYNYNRLISLCEVGGDPGRSLDFDPVADLHARNERIARDWPDTMNATSTHDTKRSEDVRVRINVLSELSEEWEREVARWSEINEPLRVEGIPHANEELLIYQTLVGMWPLAGNDEKEVPERLTAYLEKAAREAKTHTSWLSPSSQYESALKGFASAILGHEPFLDAFRPFQRRVAFYGFLNALSQVVLKICSPGVPDFYQGTELWDFSLVDPDNRRPVDYERRRALSDDARSAAALLNDWQDGAVKLFVTRRALEVRAKHLDAFRGSYRALDTGTACAVAFTRGDDEVLVVLPRLTSRLAAEPQLPLGDVWGNARLDLPGRWVNAFTGELVEGVALREVLATFPVAVLEREQS